MTGALDREAEELERAFREVVKTPAGKRVLFWVLEESAVYRDAFTGEAPATDYLLGQQAIGRRLMAMLDRLDPRLYPLLLLDIAEIKAMDRAAAENQGQVEDDEDA